MVDLGPVRTDGRGDMGQELIEDDLFSRRGRFLLSLELLERMPLAVQALMATVIISRAECLWAERRIEYAGFSRFFAVVPEGATSPTYVCEVVLVGKATFEVTWSGGAYSAQTVRVNVPVPDQEEPWDETVIRVLPGD